MYSCKFDELFSSQEAKRSTLVFFSVPRNLSNHMVRQARNGDTLLAKSREMTGRTQNTAVVTGGRTGKDDRKQNTLATLGLRYLSLQSGQTTKFSVSLSPRSQRGYNSVERAEFQLREQQLRSSSVRFSERHARHPRLTDNREFHYAVGYNRGRTIQIPPAHPRSQHSMLLKLIQVGYIQYHEGLSVPDLGTPPSEAFLSLGLSLTPYPSSVLLCQ